MFGGIWEYIHWEVWLIFLTAQGCLDRADKAARKPCVHVTPAWCLCYIGHMKFIFSHYNDVIMSAMTSQITSFAIVYPTVYSATDERKHQSSASLACVREIPWWPVNSPTKVQWRGKMFLFDDVIMALASCLRNIQPCAKQTCIWKRVTHAIHKNDWIVCRWQNTPRHYTRCNMDKKMLLSMVSLLPLVIMQSLNVDLGGLREYDDTWNYTIYGTDVTRHNCSSFARCPYNFEWCYTLTE